MNDIPASHIQNNA